MKTGILAALVVVSGLSVVSAQVYDVKPLLTADTKAPAIIKPGYEMLEDLFSKGVTPDEKDVLGWYSGREFLSNSPDSPVALMLVGVKKAGQLKLLLWENEGVPGSYFDSLSLAEIYEVREVVSNGRALGSAEFTPEGLVSKYWSDLYRYTAVIRKSGRYLVVKWDGATIGERRASYSYFFLNVTPQK